MLPARASNGRDAGTTSDGAVLPAGSDHRQASVALQPDARARLQTGALAFRLMDDEKAHRMDASADHLRMDALADPLQTGASAHPMGAVLDRTAARLSEVVPPAMSSEASGAAAAIRFATSSVA